MNDRIEQLLRSADAETEGAAVPPPEAGALAGRVRAVARRRRIVRRAAGAAAACAIAVTIAATLVGPNEPPDVVAVRSAPPAARDVRAELVALRAEADREAERAARMIAVDRLRTRDALLRRGAATADPSEHARMQLERAALSMVYQADRLTARGAPAAERVYAAAAENFPNTHWAGVARDRLAGVRERKDGSG